jgi:hypothetical protein
MGSASVYDDIVALPREDVRRGEIAQILGCHHLSTAMLRILKIQDPAEKQRVTEQVRAVLDRKTSPEIIGNS